VAGSASSLVASGPTELYQHVAHAAGSADGRGISRTTGVLKVCGRRVVLVVVCMAAASRSGALAPSGEHPDQ
jgi:hypothetical protein